MADNISVTMGMGHSGSSIDDRFDDLEKRIEKAEAFMKWVQRVHPAVMVEFQAVQRTVPRITGVP